MNLDPECGSSSCTEVLGHLCCARDLSNLLCSQEEGSLRSFDRITKRKVCILLSIVTTIFLLLYWPIYVDESAVFDEVEDVSNVADGRPAPHSSFSFPKVLWGLLLFMVLAPLVWYSGRLAYILCTLARLQES